MRTRTALCSFALLCGILLAVPVSSATIPSSLHHHLAVRLDVAARLIRAKDTITVPAGQPVVFELHSSLTPTRILVDGHPATPATVPHAEIVEYRVPTSNGSHTLQVDYSGVLAPLVPRNEREVLRALPPMIAADGSYFPSGSAWYPDLGIEVCTYRVHIEVPADQRAIVPGELVSEVTRQGRYESTFEVRKPSESLALMAGPYVMREQVVHGDPHHSIRLRTYFHPDIADLGNAYLSDSARYLAMYAKWIGPYPYASFSIVSSPLPTGFGMPGVTYIGRDVLRLPFIRASSLGHEILHNWWGNGVRVDWADGNWSEALTTFMADYTFKEQEGSDAAREMRWAWLRDFAAVPPAQDRPVREFRSRTHDPSQIIGYSKGAFLFYMLRDAIGQDAFNRGIRTFWARRQFQRAGWDDLRSALEATSGRNLKAFFDQWLARAGAASVRIEAARVENAPTGNRVHVTLSQDSPTYALQVPLGVATDAGREDVIVSLTERQQFVLPVAARPRSLVVDPDFRLFRRLAPSELPPIVREITLQATTQTTVLGADRQMREAGLALATRLLDREPTLAHDHAGKEPRLVIGTPGDVDAWLREVGAGPRPGAVQGGTAQVWASRDANGNPLLIISATDASALQALLRPLPHYGRQSYLVFDGAKVVDRGIWPAHSPEWRFE